MNRLNHLIICVPLVWILVSHTFAHGTRTVFAGRIPAGAYQYLEQSEKGASPFEWRISYPGDLVEISVDSEEYKTFNRCQMDGETLFWSVFRSDGLVVSAERQDDVLIITQTSKGATSTVKYHIDDRPWYQPLSFSLHELLSGKWQSIEFWSIRIDTNEPVLLKATRIGTEDLNIENQVFSAVIVEIKATGLLSMFWSGSYWFSEDNDLFLKYKSRISVPGMADKNVTLVSWATD